MGIIMGMTMVTETITVTEAIMVMVMYIYFSKIWYKTQKMFQERRDMRENRNSTDNLLFFIFKKIVVKEFRNLIGYLYPLPVFILIFISW